MHLHIRNAVVGIVSPVVVGFIVLVAGGPALGAPALVSGSPYDNVDLGQNDGQFTILWEGNTLVGAGSVDSYTYYSRTTNAIRPLIVEKTGSSYSVVGVGTLFLPNQIGMQYNIPFGPFGGGANGVNTFDTSGGSQYFFAFSPVGTNILPVAYNDNAETLEGHPVGYALGQTTSAGPINLTFLSGSSARHYLMTVHTTQAGIQETVDSELVNRTFVDGAGFTFVRTDTAFTQTGKVSKWAGFADVTSAHTITPLILRNVGGTYEVEGIGTARTFSSRDFFNVDFDLVSGTDIVQPGDLIGWWDSGNTGGVIPYDLNFLSSLNSQDTVRYFSTGASALSPGQNLGAGTFDERGYSISFETVAVPEPTTATLVGLAGLGLLRRRRGVSYMSAIKHNKPR